MTAENSNVRADTTGEVRRGVKRGLTWSLLGNAVLRLGTFATSLLLARILAPADFGTYAIGLTFLQIAIILNDVGITTAIVQWRGQLADILPTARLLSYLGSLVVAGVLFGLSNTIAEVAGNSAAGIILRLLALCVLLDGMMAVSTACLWRKFEHSKFISASLAGFLAQATVSIGAALVGCGAISFAFGMIADAIVRFVLVSTLSRASFRPGFDKQIAANLLAVGAPFAAALALQATLLNVDYLVISRTLDATQLGFYTLAFNISSWLPGVVGTALSTVTLAGFSRLAERGIDALSRAARKAFAVLVKVLLPLVVILCFAAQDVVLLAYGEKWLPAASVLGWLSLYILPRMLAQTATEVLVALGRARLPVVTNVVWLAVLVPSLIAGAALGGIEGAAMAQAAVGCLIAMPTMLIALRLAGVRLGGLLASVARPALGAVLAAAAAAATSRALSPHPAGLSLLVDATLVSVVYGLVGLHPYERRAIRSKLLEVLPRGNGGHAT